MIDAVETVGYGTYIGAIIDGVGLCEKKMSGAERNESRRGLLPTLERKFSARETAAPTTPPRLNILQNMPM
jgi:hypothetical protein